MAQKRKRVILAAKNIYRRELHHKGLKRQKCSASINTHRIIHYLNLTNPFRYISQDGRVRLFLQHEDHKLATDTFSRMGLTAAEQREFQQRMERKQMKEFMGVSQRFPLTHLAPFHLFDSISKTTPTSSNQANFNLNLSPSSPIAHRPSLVPKIPYTSPSLQL